LIGDGSERKLAKPVDRMIAGPHGDARCEQS
jgi:hypothetical protein